MADPTNLTARGLLLRALGRHRRSLGAGMALIIVWHLCETLVPVLIGLTIDRAVATGDVDALLRWGVALIVLFSVLSYAYRFGSRLGFSAVQRETHLLRLEIAGHALAPRGVRTRLLPGETLSLATSDAESVGFALRSLIFTLSSAASLIVSGWLLLRIDVVLGLVVIGGVPLVLVLIQGLSPLIARRAGAQQAAAARATGIASDLVRGLRVLKGIGAEDTAAQRYRAVSRDAQRAGIRSAESYAAMTGVTDLLSGLFLAIVALLAGRAALAGEISIGELVMVVGLTQFIAEPIRGLGDLSAQFARAHGSARRIADYLASPALVSSGTHQLSDPGRAKPVSVESDALRFTSAPGEILGIAVDDPATAADLLAALAEGSATVRLDGVALDALTLESRRQHLAVIPHHVDLFEGTLRSNVDPTGLLDDVALAALLDASAADDVVAADPAGLDAAVTPDGTALSGGQRQRLALARALASAAPWLVLHDPTTAVDAVTEHRIAAGVRALRHDQPRGLTTWLITSSPALLAAADRVVLIRDGRVVASGTHHDLGDHPDYQELVLR
ncbi:ABC transporter transmembrane domain-containing protein [Nocardioides sp. Bht2]|uniref:ABC transporter transmembrane domain-containing protein n=1 Tax=Nocardioides sp. Bht2 TaxID=3392297 RepID=UPI0039B6D659